MGNRANDYFIHKVRDKINKRRNKTAFTMYMTSFIAIFSIALFIQSPIDNNSIGRESFSFKDSDIYDSYILSEDDILLYLIDELELDEFLSLSIEQEIFEDIKIIKQEY